MILERLCYYVSSCKKKVLSFRSKPKVVSHSTPERDFPKALPFSCFKSPQLVPKQTTYPEIHFTTYPKTKTTRKRTSVFPQAVQESTRISRFDHAPTPNTPNTPHPPRKTPPKLPDRTESDGTDSPGRRSLGAARTSSR